MTTLTSAVAIGDTQLHVDTAFAEGSFPGYVKIDDELLNVGGRDNLTGKTLVLSQPAAAIHDSAATVTYAGRPYDANFLAATGGASEVTVLKRTTVLTDAQIKTLKSDWLEIVPDQGTNKIIDFIRVVLTSNIVTPYTGVDAGAYLYFVSGSGHTDLATYVNNNATIYNGMVEDLFATSNAIFVSPGVDADHTVSGTSQPTGAFGVDDLDGALFLTLSNGADLGGGNAANTLTVTVLYTVIDL